MRLYESNTKTMIVSWSSATHPQLTPTTIGGTVLDESVDLNILGATLKLRLPLRQIFVVFPEQLPKGSVS